MSCSGSHGKGLCWKPVSCLLSSGPDLWAKALLSSCLCARESPSLWPVRPIAAEAGPAWETAVSPQMASQGAWPDPFLLWSPAYLTQATLWGCGQEASFASSVWLPQWHFIVPKRHSIVPERGGPFSASPRPGFQEALPDSVSICF